MIHVRSVLHTRSSANGGFHFTSNWRLTGLLAGLTSGTEWSFREASNWGFNTQGEQSTSNWAWISPEILSAAYRSGSAARCA